MPASPVPRVFVVEFGRGACSLTPVLPLPHPSDETSVLHACDREGSVRIVAEGRHYLLRATPAVRGPMGGVPDFEGRLHTAFTHPLTAAQTAAADRILAGE